MATTSTLFLASNSSTWSAELLKRAIQFSLATVLSSQTGVRAFLPMFILSAISIADNQLVELDERMQWLRHPVTCGLSGLLATAEVVAEHIPAVDHAIHAAMTFIAPIVGVVLAIAPKLGDDNVTSFVQAPMAIFGGSTALIFHLIKLAVRVLGCGCLTPVIALVETIIVSVIIPLSLFFGVLAIVLAIGVLIALVRWLVRTCRATGQGVEEALFGPYGTRARRTLNYVRREHLVFNGTPPTASPALPYVCRTHASRLRALV